MSLIELTGLGKIYPMGNRQVTALADLDLNFEQGEFSVLAGPSGSGKTTVLNLIGGLDQPTSGNVVISGRSTGNSTPAELAEFRLRHIGFVFQSYNLIPVLSAAENVEFPLILQRLPKTERRSRISTLFRQLGIAGLEDRRPSDLSGGQQQRVAVARAIATRPTVVLADEPTANLDSQSATDLLTLMRQLNTKEKTTFVFSSHDPQVIGCARRVITLKDGRLQSDLQQSP